MKNPLPKLAALFLATALMACATETRMTTVQMASAIGDMQQEQILNSLSVAIDTPSAIPAQMIIKQGTAASSLGLSPTFKNPNLKYGLADTLSPKNAPLGLQTFSLSGSDSWEAQFQISPVVDMDELRRIRLLYAVVTHPEDYPDRKSLDLLAFNLLEARNSSNAQSRLSFLELKTLTHDLLYGISEQCRRYINEDGSEAHNVLDKRWLFWKSGNNWQPEHEALNDKDIVAVGSGGKYQIGVAREARSCLNDFIILIQWATPAAGTAGDKKSP